MGFRNTAAPYLNKLLKMASAIITIFSFGTLFLILLNNPILFLQLRGQEKRDWVSPKSTLVHPESFSYCCALDLHINFYWTEINLFPSILALLICFGLSMWDESSKILYFIDFWHSSFCRFWRPWKLLWTKSKGHKSNVHCQWVHRQFFMDES